jgi:hypothetical protein
VVNGNKHKKNKTIPIKKNVPITKIKINTKIIITINLLFNYEI